ncbi:hypothetical protein DSO57_1023240 [Entomophthora muscae]|uniref:Uncharacterized protein n=1 Tax=Entomophthora muscae TaxID=34485 RepID=A0ACC2RHN4_9FUNG|nr:hypothetical protein DSO57_1023240 [Entomophthora muscae]
MKTNRYRHPPQDPSRDEPSNPMEIHTRRIRRQEAELAFKPAYDINSKASIPEQQYQPHEINPKYEL